MISLLSSERRKRILPPRSLVVLGWFVAVFPLLNYFYLANAMQTSWRYPTFLLLPGVRWVLPALILAPLAAWGLLRIKKWGWYAFLFFALYLMAHNGLALLKNPAFSNVGALVSVTFGTIIAIYICQKDVAAPYFRMYPRGWRYQKRYPVQIPVKINGKEFQTTDLSDSGFYVEMDSTEREALTVGQACQVELQGQMRDAGVVRLDDTGVGFALRKTGRK
ncbi:MAG: hypothetical protein HS115_12325 [Spirochaetales bacterium]|nr:hypothetical protein [Spirochaetales bacterium]